MKIKSTLILLLAGLAASVAIYIAGNYVLAQDSHILTAAAAIYFITGAIMKKPEEAGLAAKVICINLPIMLIVVVLAGGELAFIGTFTLTTVLFSGAGIIIRTHREKISKMALSGGIVSAIIYIAIVGFYVFPQIMANDKLTVTNTPAPQFELMTAGGKLQSADLEGKVVLINFWATWCSKCLQELPSFDEVHNTYKDNKDVMILAVDLGTDGESLEKAQKFIDKKGYRWNVAFDADTSAFSAMSLEDIPATVILDKKGHIRLIHTGYNATEDYTGKMNAEIEKLLAE